MLHPMEVQCFAASTIRNLVCTTRIPSQIWLSQRDVIYSEIKWTMATYPKRLAATSPRPYLDPHTDYYRWSMPTKYHERYIHQWQNQLPWDKKVSMARKCWHWCPDVTGTTGRTQMEHPEPSTTRKLWPTPLLYRGWHSVLWNQWIVQGRPQHGCFQDSKWLRRQNHRMSHHSRTATPPITIQKRVRRNSWNAGSPGPLTTTL
jgi:hypothetical protein